MLRDEGVEKLAVLPLQCIYFVLKYVEQVESTRMANIKTTYIALLDAAMQCTASSQGPPSHSTHHAETFMPLKNSEHGCRQHVSRPRVWGN